MSVIKIISKVYIISVSHKLYNKCRSKVYPVISMEMFIIWNIQYKYVFQFGVVTLDMFFYLNIFDPYPIMEKWTDVLGTSPASHLESTPEFKKSALIDDFLVVVPCIIVYFMENCLTPTCLHKFF